MHAHTNTHTVSPALRFVLSQRCSAHAGNWEFQANSILQFDFKYTKHLPAKFFVLICLLIANEALDSYIR